MREQTELVGSHMRVKVEIWRGRMKIIDMVHVLVRKIRVRVDVVDLSGSCAASTSCLRVCEHEQKRLDHVHHGTLIEAAEVGHL